MAVFSKFCTAPDKRSWATLEQIRWLVSWLQEYIEAQQTHQLHIFWPKLFTAWFEKFPLPEPTDNDAEVPESELQDDSDVLPESADENVVKAQKKKRKVKDNRRKAQAKKVYLHYSLFYLCICLLYLGCLQQNAYTRAEDHRTVDFEATRGELYMFASPLITSC